VTGDNRARRYGNRGNYGGGMRRFFTIVIRIALVAAAFGVVRQVLLDRSSQQALRGQPVIGSLDTWPTVPRRPTDSTD
jgi:hypothetical protein